MSLIRINELTIRYRGPALLDDVSCVIEPGQRIGLLGRNGAGKSTLLKLIAGSVEPDHGTVQRDGKVAMLPQEVPQDLSGRVFDVVRAGLQLDDAQAVDEGNSWELDHKVDRILSDMSLDPEASVHTMSSGMKRRVLLARALADRPDLLLLDEPTNHLDIESIRWLEDYLARWNQAFMFITHDRQFLRRLADRILEIDRAVLFDWTCDYDTFLKRKEDALAAEEKQNALFDKKLAEEEAWIRQGIKARRTRNEGRVRALKELREIRGDRREHAGTSQLNIQEGERSGNLVLVAKDLEFAHKATSEGDAKGKSILTGFSTTIMRGDRVGVIGPNGAGKTTLLRILLGKLEPDSGSVRLGSNLQIAYFDQLREQLDESNTVEQEVADGYQTVNINGNSRHVLGYLQDFLFTAERARTPIKRLSGGERNRILLAKLFAKPANLIILDEPTNDLDAESLEMLEERLGEFKGTILVVSHDRQFLNNVVTSCIVFEKDLDGRDGVKEYVGGYDDWQTQRAKQLANRPKIAAPEKSPPTSAKNQQENSNAKQPPENKKRKLTFKETKELEELPGIIENIEGKIAEIHEAMAEPSFYQQDGEVIAREQESLNTLNQELETAYARWEELEG